jgi:hypothetical protein
MIPLFYHWVPLDFAELAVSAMLTGTMSTWLTAAVAGVIL